MMHLWQEWLAPLLIFILLTSDCNADTIRLKNNRTMEGIIKEETENQIVLDVGFGTVTVSKDDIEGIERRAKQDEAKIVESWKGKFAQTGRWTPKNAEELFENFKAIKKKRRPAVESDRERDQLQAKIVSGQKNISSLYAKFKEMNEQLKSMDSQSDVFAYNSLVADINTASAQIRQLNDEVAEYMQQKNALDKRVLDYMNELSSFTDYFNEEYAKLKEKGIETSDENFYKSIQEGITELKKDFAYEEIEFQGDPSKLIVVASLNRKTKASLVVDTGASIVTISKDTAERLGITRQEGLKEIDITLADGTKSKAVPVILDSVKVGGFEAKNVFAAITDSPPGPDIDGLLGMSFLNNFVVKIDSKNNKLLLEKFKP